MKFVYPTTSAATDSQSLEFKGMQALAVGNKKEAAICYDKAILTDPSLETIQRVVKQYKKAGRKGSSDCNRYFYLSVYCEDFNNGRDEHGDFYYGLSLIRKKHPQFVKELQQTTGCHEGRTTKQSTRRIFTGQTAFLGREHYRANRFTQEQQAEPIKQNRSTTVGRAPGQKLRVDKKKLWREFSPKGDRVNPFLYISSGLQSLWPKAPAPESNRVTRHEDRLLSSTDTPSKGHNFYKHADNFGQPPENVSSLSLQPRANNTIANESKDAKAEERYREVKQILLNRDVSVASEKAALAILNSADPDTITNRLLRACVKINALDWKGCVYDCEVVLSREPQNKCALMLRAICVVKSSLVGDSIEYGEATAQGIIAGYQSPNDRFSTFVAFSVSERCDDEAVQKITKLVAADSSDRCVHALLLTIHFKRWYWGAPAEDLQRVVEIAHKMQEQWPNDRIAMSALFHLAGSTGRGHRRNMEFLSRNVTRGDDVHAKYLIRPVLSLDYPISILRPDFKFLLE
ncbi:hypothetical protein Q3G72_027371 [Acer saccharum]|nr:hypothetical protein Q3G72_027371 [Acer saccharum]